MLSRLFAWLRTPFVVQTQEEHLQQMLEGLCSPDAFAFERASHTFANVAFNRNADFSPEYTIMVLNALAEKEGLREIDALMRQVEFMSKPSLASTATPPVRTAAQHCLQRLRKRMEPDYLAQTLLRAAQTGPKTPPALLLRTIDTSSGPNEEEWFSSILQLIGRLQRLSTRPELSE